MKTLYTIVFLWGMALCVASPPTVQQRVPCGSPEIVRLKVAKAKSELSQQLLALRAYLKGRPLAQPETTEFADFDSTQIQTWLDCLRNEKSEKANKDKFEELETSVQTLLRDYQLNLQKYSSMSVEERAKITALQSANSGVADIVKSLSELADSAESSFDRAEANLQKMKMDPSVDSESQIKLQRFMMRLALYQSDFVKAQKDDLARIVRLTKSVEDLKRDTSDLKNSNVIQTYRSVNDIWRVLADDLIANVAQAGQSELLPDLPTTSGLVDESRYESEYEAAKQLSKTVGTKIAALRKEVIDQEYKALIQVGKARSDLFQKAMDLQSISIFDLSDSFEADIGREIRIVPARLIGFLVSKTIAFKWMVKSGIVGWLKLIVRISVVLILLIFPLWIFLLFRRVSAALEEARKELIRSSIWNLEYRIWVATLLRRLNPYVPWFLMLGFSYLCTWLLHLAKLGEFSIFVPYLKIYIVYRISRLLLRNILASALISGSLDKIQRKQKDVEATALILGRVLLIEFWILYLCSDSVRHALIYTMVVRFLWVFNVFFVASLLRKWQGEMAGFANSEFDSKVWDKLSFIQRSKLSYFAMPVIFIAALVVKGLRDLWIWLGQFDVFKRLSSEILKKRLETAQNKQKNWSETQSQPIAENYAHHFDLMGLRHASMFIETDRKPVTESLELITLWKSARRQEDALLLIGDKGMGKSSCLDQIYHRAALENKVRVEVPSKTYTREHLLAVMSELLSSPISGTKDLEALDKKLQPTLVCMDNVQNLFLAKQYGFEAYRMLLDFFNVRTENIFWVLCMNKLSWNYLNGVFGRDHFFGHSIELHAWSDTEIQKLIIDRHQQTGYQMAFDRIITAFDPDAEEMRVRSEQAETHFFRLLWSQSRGNPRIAQVLWLSALKQVSQNEVLVGIPDMTGTKSMGNVSDDVLFVYSAILKHENLTVRETEDVTNLSSATVKKAFKIGEDSGVLFRGKDGRFRIAPRTQNIVINYLLGKNFLYE